MPDEKVNCGFFEDDTTCRALTENEEGKIVREESCTNELENRCCYVCSHQKTCEISCSYLQERGTQLDEEFRKYKDKIEQLADLFAEGKISEESYLVSVKALENKLKDMTKGNENALPRPLLSGRTPFIEEDRIEFGGEYLGGHPAFPKKANVCLILKTEVITIPEMHLRIPYQNIKRIENMTKEKITKTRVLLLGVVGALWKKEQLYMVLTYEDKTTESEINMIFSMNDIEEAQPLIYERMTNARARQKTRKSS